MRLTSFTTSLPAKTAFAILAGLVIYSSSSYAQPPNSRVVSTRSVIVVDRGALAYRLGRDAASRDPSIVILGPPGGASLQRDTIGSDLRQPILQNGAELSRTRATIQSLTHASAFCARRFFVTDVGTLGGTESFAYAINNVGHIVGSSRTAGDLSTHSFLYTHGVINDLFPLNSQDLQTVGPTGINAKDQIASGVVSSGVYVPTILDSRTGNLTLLGTLGGITSFGFNGVATSINDRGHAVGYSYVNALNRHAFLYRNGVMTDIAPFEGDSIALANNNYDQIVGSAADSDTGVGRAFEFANGVLTAIGPDTESTARGINNWGQVVGEYLISDQSAFHAFLFSNGNFIDFGVGPETVAYSINDWGQIVGIFQRPFETRCEGEPCIEFKQRAFTVEKGRIVDLNDLILRHSGWQLIWAFDVNDLGQIVGYGQVNDKFRAFVLTPAISKLQCKHNGWQLFGFKNQGQCVRFVNQGN